MQQNIISIKNILNSVLVYSKNADQSREYEILIYGDDKQLKSVIANRKSQIQHIEVDVTGIEYLQIIGKGKIKSINGDTIYHSLIVNPYLY